MIHEHKGENREAWDSGLIVPCEKCFGEGMTAHQLGNTITTRRCKECQGSGYVMESANDK